MRILRSLSVLVLFGLIATGLQGAGTIDTTGATITAGSGKPSGDVTIDPCAPQAPFPPLPPLGDLGSIGSIATMPEFPGAGDESNDAFVGDTDQTLAGGTYNHTTYWIQPA